MLSSRLSAFFSLRLCENAFFAFVSSTDEVGKSLKRGANQAVSNFEIEHSAWRVFYSEIGSSSSAPSPLLLRKPNFRNFR